MTDEPAPGMPGNPVTLTDPKAMRALAHPARIAIWAHLGLHGPATATECADVAEISPSACSYHLRALARYGFVEEDPDSAADGRQRPWRARLISFQTWDPSGNPATDVASQFLVETMRASMEEIRTQYVSRRAEYPEDWRRAVGETNTVVHVSPAELNELRARILELTMEYMRLEPSERPAGALPVRVGLDMFPWFGPEEVQR
jgi:DNA-binding transcriptional ArsR family regulator